LRIRFEVQNAASQYVFVEKGQACAVMSPLSVENYRRTRPDRWRVAFIPFRPKVLYRIAILTPAHKSLSRLTRAFAEELKLEVCSLIDQ